MQHSDLPYGKWAKMSLYEQLANIGSEVIRAMKWKSKGNEPYADAANVRALELFDLAIDQGKSASLLKELCRARELWLDYFIGENQYHQTEKQWEKYFFAFTYAARKDR